ncbi:hypothetical protein N7536_004530 [Penicillium majusculum]|nr:hypothetical protein N7536_004530 [Penicillium majusculum]
MQNQHHRGPTSLKRFAIRRTQKPDSNSTGDNEALTIPSPLSPIVEANSTKTHVFPLTKSNQSKPRLLSATGGPGTC